MINTTQGPMDEALLARTVIFEDRPTEFVVAVEWRFEGELVRRDAHVILKDPSPIATAIIGHAARDVTVGLSSVAGRSDVGGLR